MKSVDQNGVRSVYNWSETSQCRRVTGPGVMSRVSAPDTETRLYPRERPEIKPSHIKTKFFWLWLSDSLKTASRLSVSARDTDSETCLHPQD